VDSTRFDGLTKELWRGHSRRHLLRTLAAGSGIGLLVRLSQHGEARAAPGLLPLRCVKRGAECDPEGEPPCCGKKHQCRPVLGTNPQEFRCQNPKFILK
jgi:hypothetical protein